MEAPAQPNTALRSIHAPAASKSLAQRLFPYVLVAPTFILVMIFTLLPAVRTVLDSLYQPGRRPSDPWQFVGLQNYADLLNSSHHIGARFTQILSNTFLFAGVTVLVCVPLALMFALLLNRRLPLRGLLRFGIFYPALLPLIGAASIWAFLYSDSIGLINTVLRSLGGAGVNWIGDPNTVLWAVIIFNIWKQSGYYMIFYLAGLQSIPVELYEAAKLDGAN